jgi:S-adenosylmethionine hydrolase
LAAAIARGVAVADWAKPTDRVVALRDIPSVSIESGRVLGTGRHIDRFGNILSDIPRVALERTFGDVGRVRTRVAELELGAFVRTYADAAPGRPVALLNSWDLVEVAVGNGRACDVLCATRPEQVRFTLEA